MNKTDQTIHTSIASIHTRSIEQVQPRHNQYPEIHIDEQFRIDAKPFINRPIFISNVSWADSVAQYTPLTLPLNRLPLDVINSNPSLSNAVKLGAYYRSDLTLNISIAGTITHAGTLLVGILPPLSQPVDIVPQPKLINTLLSGPHGFLTANEATSLALHVPWYCNSDLASLDVSTTDGSPTGIDTSNLNGNYATLVIMVLNPLQPSTGSSQSVTLVIEAIFNSLDILVPSPKYITYSLTPPITGESLKSLATGLIDGAVDPIKSVIGDGVDMMRSAIRTYTGLHNPNYSGMSDKTVVSLRNYGNVVSTNQYFEKLDPRPDVDRILQKPDFHTTEEEMDIQNIVGKPQYLGTFRQNENDNVGTLLWDRPISPYQGSTINSDGSASFANNIQLMHYLSRAWKGTIKIHIQSVMNNKQQTKLKLIQLYNPSSEVAQKYPTYRSILNAPSHLIEFTAGNQIQTIELPYLSRNNIMHCMRDSTSEGLFHGMYYIYVAQNLANSGGSPTDVYFNVYYSLGDDFQFYGYSTELMAVQPPVNSPDITVLPFVGESLDVMNEPQDQKELTENKQEENPVYEFSDRLVPYKNIREIVRRMYKTDAYRISIIDGTGSAVIPLSSIIGELISDNLVSPLYAASSMYYGKHAGFKFKLKMKESVAMSIRYIPQNFFIDQNSSTIMGSRPEISNLPNSINEYATGPSYPLPFQEVPVQSMSHVQNTTNYALYEFIIPNTTIYKFIGGPDKMTSTQDTQLSIADMGHLLLTLNAVQDGPQDVVMYCGLTDESRLGFHAIAPIIFPAQDSAIQVLETLYSGDYFNGPDSQPSTVDNNIMYFTRT